MLYPIGIQNFEDLREEGCVYVDKTARMYELTSTGKFYFLSRPRRFGKSLLVSTLEAYFLGKRELFKGLAIEQLEKEWKKYPVLYLDLNTGKYDTLDNLERNLNSTFLEWEEIYGSSEEGATFEMRFKRIVQQAYEKTGLQVVILVDEYDKPILTAIDNEALQEQFRSTLKSIYSVLKTQGRYIRFAFLTGVSKFSHLSVFSDLNNLKDITLDERYADICGISKKELHTYFDDSIKELAKNNSMTFEDACAELEKLYDGYHFAPNSAGMYNPFSLLNTLESKKFGKYWYRTGTPTFLVKMLQNSDYNLNGLQNESATAELLDSVESLDNSAIPLLYQCGYLTITGYDKRFDKYHLGFPNLEVEQGFTNFLLPFYIKNKDKKASDFLDNFVCDVEEGRPECFMSSMKTLLDGNSYQIAGKLEIYFQNVMCLIFKIMGFYTQVEYATSDGRIDIVVKTKNYIYLIEVKVDVPADEALAQIEAKDYAKVFAADERKLYKIGVCFSNKTRSISEYKIKT